MGATFGIAHAMIPACGACGTRAMLCCMVRLQIHLQNSDKAK